jgi:hypothetical protein
LTKDGVASKQLASKQHPISNSAKAPKAGSSDDTLKKVMGMVDSWLAYRKKLLPIWERDTKLYNNERVEKHYEGVADTFVPMTYSTLEAISAALITADYNTDFVPQDIYKYLKDRLMPGYTGTVVGEDGTEIPESEEDYLIRAIQNAVQGGPISDESLEVLNAYYDYVWDCGDWESHIGEMIDSGLQIGNGSLWMVFENGKPKLISVPFPDYIFDPTATDDDSGHFGGRKYLASLKKLKDEVIVDPGTGKTKKRYNLTGMKKRTTGSADDKTAKELMEQMLFGSTLEVKDDKGNLKNDLDQCEVIEIMTEDRMYTLVNRSCVAEDVENPIVAQAKLRGIEDLTRLIKIPGITWANNKKGSLFVGRSETSTFWKEQERLNDATNQKSDAVTRALLQNYRADPALKSQKNSFSVPGAVVWGQSGSYEAIAPAQVPNVAFTEENSIKNNIRETTATDQIVKGVGSTTDVTATEAKLQVAQSGQRIEKKIKQLERGPLKRIARLALQYIRLFITDPFIVPQQANGGINPRLYVPSKYDYDFEPKVTLTVAAQEKRKQDQKDAAENFQIVIQDPTNNLQAAKELLYPKMLDLDKDEIKRITENPSAMMPGQMPPEAMGPMPPQMPMGAPA